MSNDNLITVVDAVMGTGKSTWAIDEIQKHPERKYVVLTPLQTEVTRYKEELSTELQGTRSDIVALDDDTSGTKTPQFLQALKDGKTIVATHVLFLDWLTDECFDLIFKGEYHLMLDETLTMMKDEYATEEDINSLLKEGYLTEDSTGIDGLIQLKPTLTAIDYLGSHKDFLSIVGRDHVYRVNRTTVIFVVPPEKIAAFNHVNILTYLFDKSEMHGWLELFNFKHEHLKLTRKSTGTGYNLDPHDLKYSGSEFKANITIFDNKKQNAIGEKKANAIHFPLSSNWYKKNPSKVDALRKLTRNYFERKEPKVTSKDFLWTCPKGYREKVTNRYFDPAKTDTFLPFNYRATNKYDDRHKLAFLKDVYMRLNISNFFKEKKINVSNESYALSTLLQWTWRSAIRKDEAVTIYLPSKRMRGLLTGWLDGTI